MKIFVSYITDHFSVLQHFWKRSKERNEGGAFHGTDNTVDLDLGGLVQVIDWSKKRVEQELSLPTPAGFDYSKQGIYLATGGTRIVLLDESLQIREEMTNFLFNDLHGLNLTPRGILVSSTGLDTILEISSKSSELFRWTATEHGYKVDPKGRCRKINLNEDHRDLKYPTLQQTTHVNSALYVGKTRFFEETIYASLFHQGEIVAINRETGESCVVMSGLNHPHSLYEYDGMILFSDSENNRVIITDVDFRENRPLYFSETDWIQDTSLLSNGNILLCDSNNHRILQADVRTGEVVDALEYSQEYKIYQAKELK